MSNVSLARIMYGTNDDSHSRPSVKAPGISSSVVQVPTNPFGGSEPLTLQELLHKAWLHLTHKC
jgi:hypothetical protein